MKTYRILAGVSLLVVFALLSCEEDRTSKYPKKMVGQVSFSAPEYVVSGYEAAFTVSNALTDPVGNLTYEWSAPDFIPPTGEGEHFIATAPANSVNAVYPVFLTVRAAGYTDWVVRRDVPLTVRDTMPAGLMIKGNQTAFIGEEMTFEVTGFTPPANADVWYEWTTTGGGFIPSGSVTRSTRFTSRLTATELGTYTVHVKAVDSTGRYMDSRTASLPVSNSCAPMTGKLVVTSSPSTMVRKDSILTLTAHGITKPTEGMHYVWDFPADFDESAATYSADSATVNIPAPSLRLKANITVTALAEGYCAMTEVTAVEVVDCIPTEGTFTITTEGTKDANDNFRPGTAVNFKITPSKMPGNVTYKWTAPGLSAGTAVGAAWTTTIPKEPIPESGVYVVTVTPTSAAGYCLLPQNTTVPVAKTAMQGAYSIHLSGTGVSAEGTLVHPGSLLQMEVMVASGAYPNDATFEWSIQPDGGSATPIAGTDKLVNYTFPKDEGTYIIMVTIKANGYRDNPVSKVIEVKKSTVPGTWNLTLTGDGVQEINGQTIIRPEAQLRMEAHTTSESSPASIFTWTIHKAGGSSTTISGTTDMVEYTFPKDLGVYDIIVTINAEGYDVKTIRKTVEVKLSPVPGTWTIKLSGEDITDNGTQTIIVHPGMQVVMEAGSTAPSTPACTFTWTIHELEDKVGDVVKEGSGIINHKFEKEGNYKISASITASNYALTTIPHRLIKVQQPNITGTLIMDITSQTNPGITGYEQDRQTVVVHPNSKLTLKAATSDHFYAADATFQWLIKKGATELARLTKSMNEPVEYTFSDAGDYTVDLALTATGYVISPVSKNISVRPTPIPGSLALKLSGAGITEETAIIHPNSQLTMEATIENGTYPAGTTFKWAIQKIGSNPTIITETGNALQDHTFNEGEGSYTIRVTLNADGYESRSIEKNVEIRKSEIPGNLEITLSGVGVQQNGTTYIVQPTSLVTLTAHGLTTNLPVTYTWKVGEQIRGPYDDITAPEHLLPFTFPEEAEDPYFSTIIVKATVDDEGYKAIEKSINIHVQKSSFVFQNNDERITIRTNPFGPHYTSEDITFMAPNITQANKGQVTYTWTTNVAGFSPSSYSNQNSERFDTRTPNVAGTYEIRLKLSAPGYYDKTVSLPITLQCKALNGTLDISTTVGNGNMLYGTGKLTGPMLDTIRAYNDKEFTLTAVYTPNTAMGEDDNILHNISYKWRVNGTDQSNSTTTYTTSSSAISGVISVEASLGGCPMPVKQYRYEVIDCPYDYNDINRTQYRCEERTGTSGSKYWQAYINAGGTTYRIVQLPKANASTTAGWWFAQNLRNSIASAKCSDVPIEGCYYNPTDATTVCPSGWSLPSQTQWEEVAPAGNNVADMFAVSAGGNDRYGFSLLKAGSYVGNNFNNLLHDDYTHGAWASSSTYVTINESNAFAYATGSSNSYFNVRCRRQ